jgi:putative DNA primase/helicase
MNAQAFSARVDAVKARAHGHWPEILLHLGLDEKMIVRRANMPCPMCGGTDRFQFTDKFGEGNYHCRGCGPGGGFKLAQATTGRDFNAVLQAVERYLGLERLPTRTAPESSAERMKKLVQRLWNEARPITPGDEAGRYLARRGFQLKDYPAALRFHPSLGYYEKDGEGKSRKVAEYPAMIASVQAIDGGMVSLHRTYLSDGKKLVAQDAKKLLSSGVAGAAIRLWPPAAELAITEGIENALAVHLATGKPVWAALAAGNLEKLWVPESAPGIAIYADNDADGDFAGQASAFALARRLRRENRARTVRVFVPREAGSDWADIWLRRRQIQTRQAA